VSKRNPNISIYCHPLSLAEEPERVRAARRGEVMHSALGWLGKVQAAPGVPSAAGAPGGTGAAAAPCGVTEAVAERAVLKALATLELDPKAWKIEEEFVKPILRAFALPLFRQWFDPAARTLVEAELMDAAGDVYRPDRVAFRDGVIEIIDFKVGKREETHREQVNTYAGLLRSVFAGRQVTGYLVYIDEPAIVEVK